MTENQTPMPPQMAINAQYIKDFSVENPHAPEIFAPAKSDPIVNLGINVRSRGLAENVHEVVLMLRLEVKIEEKVAFIAELAYAGVFSIPPMSEEQTKFVLMVEAPRYLFPFARSIVSNAVRDAGFPQIVIAPIDFISLYQSNIAAPPANDTK